MSLRVSYLGKIMPVEIQVDESIEKGRILETDEGFIITLNAEDPSKVSDLIQGYYKKQLKKKVESFIKKHQPSFKVKPRKVTIESSFTKWGTCNGNRDLMFNWQLMVAPIHVIEYVVVHEMCHMQHMNHDRSFWRLVGKLIPNYELSEAWLKNHGQEA